MKEAIGGEKEKTKKIELREYEMGELRERIIREEKSVKREERETGKKTVQAGVKEEKKADLEKLRERIIKSEKLEKAKMERAEVKKIEMKKPKKSRAAFYIVVIAMVCIVIAVGLLLSMSMLQIPQPKKEDEPVVEEKPMPGEMEEALKGARDSNIEGIEIVQGSESVPSEIINPMESIETEKFVDQNNLLKVTFEITDKDNATIEEISTLSEGRITIAPAGDYSVQLLDSSGKILYEMPFNAVFMIMSNPPTKIDKIKFVFVLPRKEGAVKIAITKERRVLAEKSIETSISSSL